MSGTRPRVLLVYYSYTQQTRRVSAAMADILREHGCDVQEASIEFTDRRYVERFSVFPLRRAFFDVLGMLPAQLRRATGEIQIPAAAQRGDYDLICIGSPTWWLTTSMPIRTFLKCDSTRKLLAGKRFATFVVCRRYWRNNLKTMRKVGGKHGGEYVGGVHFTFAGGQIRSMLSLISYLGKGVNDERYLGVRIPPTNLRPDFLGDARTFANELAAQLDREGVPRLSVSCGTARDQRSST
jgi:menaquinone-dependent protoporphyrinogen IX oxidase